MAKTHASLPMRRYREGRLEVGDDLVVVEEPLQILLGGEPYQVLMRLPGWERELALGFLLTEGVLRDRSEVIKVHPPGADDDPFAPANVVDVILTGAALERRGRRHLHVAYAGCGLCAKESVSEIRRDVSPTSSDLSVTTAELLALMARLPAAQPVFRQTGGTHAAALASPDGDTFLVAEDVGRHNAMDKVIGRAFLEGWPHDRFLAVLSGRISFEMALKAARAGIPILAAVSAPTTMALELARELGITLVGLAREDRLNVYTHPERVRLVEGR
jgi:FdhD protein